MNGEPGFLERVAACNNAPAWDGAKLKGYLPLHVTGRVIGHVRESRAVQLSGKHPRIVVRADRVQVVVTTPADVTEVFDEVTRKLVDDGHAPAPRGERYPIVQRFGDRPVGEIDRAYMPWFGLRAFGVHVNGFVRRSDGTLAMWLGERARDRANWPGHLDQITAGGQPVGLGLRENALKELEEEAGLEGDVVAGLRPVGAISYIHEHESGLKPDTMFCFDLELRSDVVPKNRDGEVERFELWPVDDVVRVLRDTRRFKPNCALVALDFLVRHGLLDVDEPGYVDIVHGLRRSAPW